MQLKRIILTLLLPVLTQLETVLTGYRIEEVRGFLRYVGATVEFSNAYRHHLRCHNSDEYYHITAAKTGGVTAVIKGNLCSKDPHFYQGCDSELSGFSITNDEILCANWLCRFDTQRVTWLTEMNARGYVCNGKRNCLKGKRDEDECGKLTILPSGRLVRTDKICDDRCDTRTCEDEARCNGLTYGIYCKRIRKGFLNQNFYLAPFKICDGKTDCNIDGEDETNYAVNAATATICSRQSKVGETIKVPVHNYTHCQALGLAEHSHNTRYCVDKDLKKYQTNCTDKARVGGSCFIDGYLSNISKYVICFKKSAMICDDNIEDHCYNPSKSCTNIHKHRMCDKEKDCEDDSDETHQICSKQMDSKCRRKLGKTDKLTLPLVWIGDGIADCINGEDENTDIWPSCGEGKFRRFITESETCENVFLCLWGEPGYVLLGDLCDGLETCGNENQVCSSSQSSIKGQTSVYSTKNGLVKQLSFCLKGLQSIQYLADDNCTIEQFTFPNHQFFGVVTKTEIMLPKTQQECQHFLGEQYLFSSCTNHCKSSVCPLKNIPRYEACPDYYKNRIGTIANNEYLAFFVKSHGIYTNRAFVCDNKVKCVEYSKVCDLVDDCGDGSDENACTNHYRCKSSGQFILKTMKCDGKFHCFDMSDECNEQCSIEILKGLPLKIATLVIGGLAFLANIYIMAKKIPTIGRCKSSVTLVNKSFIILICFGDFLIGCYLLTIAIYDLAIFGKDYCTQQIEWMTSFQCSLIGILSTIGSQVSLFAMTGLSAIRLHGISGPLRVPGEVNLVKAVKVALSAFAILLTSAVIAITPIINVLEDFFVNGIKFSKELKMFIGTQNKEGIFKVLEAYYGRMKGTTLSWDSLQKMVVGMFSHDEGYEDYTNKVQKQDFYGSDGVCLFKYFVRKDDPQKEFVWAILVPNLICFIFISISYILIAAASRKSSRNVANGQNNREINKRNRKMNRSITIIITTDFCCMVPFLVICLLHFLEVLDATPWYSIISMIVLPMNSVINPLLYDDLITAIVRTTFHSVSTRFANLTASQNLIVGIMGNLSIPQEMEMNQIQVEMEGSGSHADDAAAGLQDMELYQNRCAGVDAVCPNDKEVDQNQEGKKCDDVETACSQDIEMDQNHTELDDDTPEKNGSLTS